MQIWMAPLGPRRHEVDEPEPLRIPTEWPESVPEPTYVPPVQVPVGVPA